VVFITEEFSHDGTLLTSRILCAVVDRGWWNFVKNVRDDPYSW